MRWCARCDWAIAVQEEAEMRRRRSGKLLGGCENTRSNGRAASAELVALSAVTGVHFRKSRHRQCCATATAWRISKILM